MNTQSNLVKTLNTFAARVVERAHWMAARTVRVREVMTPNPRTCGPDDTLQHAAQIMWEADCGCVPVVGADGQVLAMITDRDICMAAYTQGRPLGEILVSGAASHTVVTARESDPLETAERLTNGRPADTQLFGDPLLIDLLAWRNLLEEDRLLQDFVNPVAEVWCFDQFLDSPFHNFV